MPTKYFLPALFALSLFVLACSDDESTPETTTTDTGSEDAASDVVTDLGVEDVVEVADEVDLPPEVGGPCENQWDCDNGWLCTEGECQRLLFCGAPSNWVRCVEAVEELEADLAYRAACVDSECSLICETDDHCPDGNLCTDYGYCLPWDGEITGQDPGGDARAALQAGYGEYLMDFPIGVPLGGYGHRAAFREGRYAVSLRSSVGQFHGLYTRAVFLDNGERQLMIVRIPFIFPSMVMHEKVARALQERTGDDWRDSLILSATHTHSGPARFWQVPSDAALSVGAFGIGEFSQEVFDWLVDSMVEAAFAALDDAAPAKLGWEIMEAFDTDNQIGHDRWSETPPFDDNRALLIRIDDADGIPRVVLHSWGAHAAENGEDYASGDVHYGAERILEYRLSQEFGRYVPTMYVNQNSGSMSSDGGAQGHRFPQSVERLGHAFSDKVLDTILAMETSDDIELEARTHRFPITYDLLGYVDPEMRGDAPLPLGGPYRFGGIECYSREGWGDSDYATHGAADDFICIALHFMLHNHPPSVFMRSQITAVNLDGLTVLTMPGELTMELSWQVLRELRDEHGVDPLEAWTWGFSQDHLLYLCPTNLRGELPPFPGISTPQAPDDYPDYAFSFLQGGYEPGMSPWGYRLGDFLVERAAEAYATLEDPEFEGPLPSAYPSWYSRVEQAPFPIDPTAPGVVGTIITDVPETVNRLDTVEFAWVGGDPGAEQPQSPRVSLERKNGDNFEAILLPNFRPYDNRAFRFMTRIREGDDGWEWVVRWEELKDFPLGRYRFVVDGHYLDGTERKPYQITSREFELTANTSVVVQAEGAAGAICGTLAYPAAQWMLYQDNDDDPGEVTGNFRMRHPMVPTNVADPLITDEDVELDSLSLLLKKGEETRNDTFSVELATAGEHVADRNNVPVTRFCFRFDSDLPSGDYEATIDVVDLHGNSGEATVTFNVP